MNASIRNTFFGPDEDAAHIGNVVINTTSISLDPSVQIFLGGDAGTVGKVLGLSANGLSWITGGGGGGSGSVVGVYAGDGLVGGPITSNGALAVLANSGLLANSTGLFVNPGNNQIIANTSGLWINQGRIDHDGLLDYVANQHIDHASLYVFGSNGLTGSGALTANVVLSVKANTGILANSSGLFFDTSLLPTINIASGNGLSGGPITGSGTLSVVAGNTQLISNSTGLWANQANFDHNSLTNYVANQHIDHSGVQVLAGNGAAGGGAITANVTVRVLAGNNQLISNTTGLWIDQTKLQINALSGYLANSFIDHSTIYVSGGNGLTGSGNLTSNVSISVLANTGLTANATGLFVNATYIGTLAANSALTGQYAVKAWALLKTTSTTAVTSSGNISSMTDYATGTHAINLTSALTDTAFAVSGSTIGGTTSWLGTTMIAGDNARSKTTTFVPFFLYQVATAGTQQAIDQDTVGIMVLR